jgi:hypothetical protein
MKQYFEDCNGNTIEFDSEEKTFSLNGKQPKFMFRNPKEMMEFAAAINITANRWTNSIPDELYDSFRFQKGEIG